jgi:DNA-binding transcriptional regulator YdaS (Cro superfamily)
MDLKTFLTSWADREALAAKIGTSARYLWQLETGWNGHKASPEMAQKIEAATGGAVPKSSLRPDIWPPPAPAIETARAA